MAERPTLYYVFPTGYTYKIVAMTDDIALERFWNQGQHWVDLPKKGRDEAEQLVAVLLAEKRGVKLVKYEYTIRELDDGNFEFRNQHTVKFTGPEEQLIKHLDWVPESELKRMWPILKAEGGVSWEQER